MWLSKVVTLTGVGPGGAVEGSWWSNSGVEPEVALGPPSLKKARHVDKSKDRLKSERMTETCIHFSLIPTLVLGVSCRISWCLCHGWACTETALREAKTFGGSWRSSESVLSYAGQWQCTWAATVSGILHWPSGAKNTITVALLLLSRFHTKCPLWQMLAWTYRRKGTWDSWQGTTMQFLKELRIFVPLTHSLPHHSCWIISSVSSSFIAGSTPHFCHCDRACQDFPPGFGLSFLWFMYCD